MLRLGFCSHQAALFACRAFHYSRTMPVGKAVRVGVWEDGAFIGCVLFSRGNTPHIGRPFDLPQWQVCELTRVALAEHRTPTSRIVAIGVRMLRRHCPGLRLVVSYADPQQEHVGTIYQAMGWLYLGETARECVLRVHGRLRHPRSVGSRYGHRGVAWLRRHVDPAAERIVLPAKLKYVLPLDPDFRALLHSMVQPYPKRERSIDSDALGDQPGEGGAPPTRSLHTEEAAHG